MNYNLIRPCPKCPFRCDIPPYLTTGRVREIAGSLMRDASFPCHQTTVDGGEDEYGCETLIAGPNSQHCAGAMILLETIGMSNQMMRIAERLGFYDRERLDMDAPVYSSFEEWIEATAKANGDDLERVIGVFLDGDGPYHRGCSEEAAEEYEGRLPVETTEEVDADESCAWCGDEMDYDPSY